MAYGLSVDPFMLKEWLVQIGVWVNPETIGTDGNDPLTKFTGGEFVGYLRQGTTNVGLTREYVEALSGTPAQILRKDLIRKMLFVEGEMFQVNADLMSLLMGLNTQGNYPAGGKNYDIGHMGSEEPIQLKSGYLLSSNLTDGKELYLAIYNGQQTSEDISIALSGTDYATTGMKIEAFPHSGFTGSTANQKSYGSIWKRLS